MAVDASKLDIRCFFEERPMVCTARLFKSCPYLKTMSAAKWARFSRLIVGRKGVVKLFYVFADPVQGSLGILALHFVSADIFF